MERLVPEQTLWRSDRWIPRQWTRKSGITFDLLSAVIENRVGRLRRQASRSTRATGRPSSKSTLTAKSYRSMPSAMSTVLPVQIRTGWIMKPRDFAAREDEATNGVCMPGLPSSRFRRWIAQSSSSSVRFRPIDGSPHRDRGNPLLGRREIVQATAGLLLERDHGRFCRRFTHDLGFRCGTGAPSPCRLRLGICRSPCC